MSQREILARVRRLSSARVAKYNGQVPEDPGIWWQQITDLADELGVPITWEEWLAVAKHASRGEKP